MPGLKVHQVAREIAGPGFTEAQAAAWFRKLAGEGDDDVFPIFDKIGAAGGRPHHLYSPLTPAVALIVRALWEMGIQDVASLKRAQRKLVQDTPAGDKWIDRIVAGATKNDPDDDDRPALVIGRIVNRRTGKARTQVDILDDLEPSVELGKDEDVTVHIQVHCKALLQPWLGRRATPD